MSAPILLALRLIMVIALYAFVAMAFYILWRALKGKDGDILTNQVPIISLRYKRSDQHLDTVSFSQPQILIGRDPVSDLCIDDQTLSARHAQLTFHLGQWWVEDLNSTNGTFINQEIVDEPIVITDSDRLRCGKIEIQVLMDESGK